MAYAGHMECTRKQDPVSGMASFDLVRDGCRFWFGHAAILHESPPPATVVDVHAVVFTVWLLPVFALYDIEILD